MARETAPGCREFDMRLDLVNSTLCQLGAAIFCLLYIIGLHIPCHLHLFLGESFFGLGRHIWYELSNFRSR